MTVRQLLTTEEKKVFSELWNLSSNILSGKGSTRRERKEISDELYELHDSILEIILHVALRCKKWLQERLD